MLSRFIDDEIRDIFERLDVPVNRFGYDRWGITCAVRAAHGLPITLKDSLDTAGIVTTWGTAGRSAYEPDADAAVVARLRRAGAIVLGTLVDEMERRELSTGLVSLCIGAGMGTATIIERV